MAEIAWGYCIIPCADSGMTVMGENLPIPIPGTHIIRFTCEEYPFEMHGCLKRSPINPSEGPGAITRSLHKEQLLPNRYSFYTYSNTPTLCRYFVHTD
jgi:hypothetical protein